MKHYPCEKCGTGHRPSRHHNLPKVFFEGDGGITHLCISCHREIELYIMDAEKKASGNCLKFRRFKLDQSEYYEILNTFLES